MKGKVEKQKKIDGKARPQVRKQDENHSLLSTSCIPTRLTRLIARRIVDPERRVASQIVIAVTRLTDRAYAADYDVGSGAAGAVGCVGDVADEGAAG